jgi:hypothetical protein
MRVLVVEDEIKLAGLLRRPLEYFCGTPRRSDPGRRRKLGAQRQSRSVTRR